MKRQRNGREKFVRKALPSPGQQDGLCCLSPGEWTQTGDTGTREAGTRRNDGTRGRETALPCRVPAVLRRHGESGATGTVAASAAVDLDLRHQTLADRPETALRVRRSPQVRSSCPGGVWLDDWPALLVRSRRVQCCYAFDVKALKALPAATQQEGEAGRRAGNRKTRRGNAGGASARPGQMSAGAAF
jgi:hypothetical protein